MLHGDQGKPPPKIEGPGESSAPRAEPRSVSVELSKEPARQAREPLDQAQIRPRAKLVRKTALREAKQNAKQVRKQAKEMKKAKRKAEDDQRNELRRRITEAREKERLCQLSNTESQGLGEDNAGDADSFRSSNMHHWKHSLAKLSTYSRRSKHVIPMPGDFASKAELHEYLNPAEECTSIPQIAELPAGPPPYNPLESASLPNPNQPPPNQENPDAVDGAKERGGSGSRQEGRTWADRSQTWSRPMLCDSCYAPIRVLEPYHHCDVCNGGDRIVCMVCSDAGRRCRHELTERVSSVKRAHPRQSAPSAQTPAANRTLSTSDIQAFTPETSVKTHGADRHRCRSAKQETTSAPADPDYAEAKATIDGFEAFQRVEAMFRKSQTPNKREPSQLLDELHRQQNHVRKLERATREREDELTMRERELSLREREVGLRDREASLREQQAALRERETALFERDIIGRRWGRHGSPLITKQVQKSSTLPADEIQACEDWRATGGHVHELRPDLPESCDAIEHQGSEAVQMASNADVHTCWPPADQEETNVRGHATGHKRKASRSPLNSPPGSASKPQNPNAPTYIQGDEFGNGDQDDDDTDEEGTPKRRKPLPPALLTPQRLLACPYAKFDPERYSERNQVEKQYRGCSGRYLTDISRLKQHLYRVHKRPEHHCARCFEIFKSKEELNVHSRQAESCPLSECCFAEKFGEDQMKELKKKRPGKTVEQSWYIIFEILFPGTDAPDSPFIDDVPLQASNVINSDGDAQTRNLLEIFNEQLSQHQHAVNHTWIASREARDLINSTLAQSMAEMLRRISPTNTPSMGQTPSNLVSPTSVSAQPRSRLPTPSSSTPASPILVHSSASARKQELLPPKFDGLLDGKLDMDELTAPRTIVPEPILGKNFGPHASNEESDRENGDLTSVDLDLPDIVECGQYLEDDDYGFTHDIGVAISDINSSFDFGFHSSHLESYESYAESTRFIPVKVSSLEDRGRTDDLDPRTRTGSTMLRMTNSKRSVDSGYGSQPQSRMNSKRQNNSTNNSLAHGYHGVDGRATDDGMNDALELNFLNEGIYETLGKEVVAPGVAGGWE